MTYQVVVGAANQVTAYEIRSLLGELDEFAVADVADNTSRLEESVLRLDPDVVIVHGGLGPTPVLDVVRDLGVRRPAAAFVLLVNEVSPDVYAAAMDAGARGLLPYPAELEAVHTRLSAAAQWSRQMRAHLSGERSDLSGGPGRGRILALAGAKGGVGTTTVAAHLAFDVVRAVHGQTVCLVELDLEKGDLGSLLAIRHRLDISDLAQVCDDLNARTVTAALHRHESGLSVLLAPRDIGNVGLVTERETRLILAALRQHYDVVIVDAGAHVTPVSAAAVELADEVVLVSTPDVLALRGARRVLDAWSRLDARKPADVRLLLNRTSRGSDVQPDTAARLVPSPLLGHHLPAAFRALEPGINYRSPAEVRDRSWWERLRAVGREIDLVPEPPESHRARARSRRRLTPADEDGQVSLELIGLLPLTLLLMVIIWQVALWGTAVVFAGHAASEGARAASMGGPVAESALAAVPGWFRQGFTVTVGEDGSSVLVHAELPLLAPGVSSDRLTFDTSVDVPEE